MRITGPHSQRRKAKTTDANSTNSVDPRSRVQLKTLGQIKREQGVADEIYGDADKAARSKVTLPRFSWDK